MSDLNTMEAIVEKSREWKTKQSENDWDADVLTAETFVECTTYGMEHLFDSAIMKPYEALLEQYDVTFEPTPYPTKKPTKRPTPKPTKMPYVQR